MLCYVMAYGMYGMVWRYVWHGMAWAWLYYISKSIFFSNETFLPSNVFSFVEEIMKAAALSNALNTVGVDVRLGSGP